MSDRRITPDPARMTRSEPAQICAAVTDLCRTPDGPRDRQLLFGDTITILGDDGPRHYVQSTKDSYCGFVQASATTDATPASHRVTAPSTHAYASASFKTADKISLSFGSLITAVGEVDGYIETTQGFIPHQHLTPVDQHSRDPAAVAALFLGTPYLWGGNSRWGIDCSGLAQAALLACGIPCPGDSDMQTTLGTPATGGYQRNDLLFWKGHVALVTDAQTLIHSNAGTMSCVYEPISVAIDRIFTQGDGPVTGHRRF